MTPAAPALPARVDHLIIGAGFAGLAAAIGLEEDGERDFLVVEKASDVGGTWRANTYPGAACDVPSQLYSYSFAPNPEWSRSFSPQPEIWAYIQRVAREAGVLDRFVFDTTVVEAAWDEQAQEWAVETSAGTVRSRTLIVGAGGLSEPRLPDIAGVEDFAGALFHTAEWDHSVDLTGKKVAVIGTGASAIQVVPEIQPVVGHLDVFQRTPPYVLPRSDRAYTRVERFAFRHLPATMRLYREGVYWARETYVPAFTRSRRLGVPAKRLALKNLADHVPDPELRRRLTPTYELGCKRVLLSNTYYPAIASPTVDLVTDPIVRITPAGVVVRDEAGRESERAADAIVVATGFHTTDHPIATRIRGRDGRTLAEVWADRGMAAYKGTTVHGCPNLFWLVGPNTTLGHSSMIFIIESQLAYIRSALRTMRTHRYGTVEPRPEVQSAWNDDLQRRLRHTVWNTGGCSSWYLDEHGRNTTVWPMSTVSFRRLLAAFDLDAYRVTTEAS